MPTEAAGPLRAWVEYYRDLGVHDFYRRGGAAVAVEADGMVATVAVEESAPANSAEQAVAVIVEPVPAAPVPPVERAAALKAIQEKIGDCTRCPLSYAGRHKIVFGDGAPTARLM